MDERDKADHDERLFGMGVMRDGKHVPLTDFYTRPEHVLIADLLAQLGTARAEGERIGRERERAEIVAWMRDDATTCDCHARSEGECGCGAWYDDKRVSQIQLADHIEARDADPARGEG